MRENVMLRNYQTSTTGSPFNPLSAKSLFEGLPLNSLQSLALIKRLRQLETGDILYSKGKPACCIYILIKGTALQILTPEDKAGIFSRSIDRNEICGLTETVSEIPYHWTVATSSPCVFEVIGKDDFRDFLQHDSAVCFRLLELLGQNLHKSYQVLSTSIS